MKKLTATLLIGLFIGSIFSCKPREKCPAYGYQKPAKAIKSIEG